MMEEGNAASKNVKGGAECKSGRSLVSPLSLGQDEPKAGMMDASVQATQ